MKYSITTNSCRICLQKSKKMRSIYKPLEEEEEAPNDMLNKLTGITIKEENVEEPKQICKSCELSLNLAFQFRLKALKSQRIIDQYKAAAACITNKVKEEIEDVLNLHESLEEKCIHEEDLNCSNEEMKVEELDINFSEAQLDEDDGRVEYLEDSFLDVVIENDGQPNEMETNRRQVSFECRRAVEPTSESESFKPASPASLRTDKSAESKNCDRRTSRRATWSEGKRRKPKTACTKLREQSLQSEEATSEQRAAGKRGRPIKKANDESSYICDICGNIYAKRGRMMEHRRRHDTELRYGCEFCDLRFPHREKLRKHMYSHSGHRPYKCSFCSRTFFYESVKKTHEAIHSGHKPYVCDVCNKPFAYSQALKMHKLIHADIKLYHCGYCHKDFRLQHHMKQHEETKLHQIAVESAKEGRKFGHPHQPLNNI